MKPIDYMFPYQGHSGICSLNDTAPRVPCVLPDPPGDDAGDRLRPRWGRVPGGVDPGGHDHHPPAGPAGPRDSESAGTWEHRP